MHACFSGGASSLLLKLGQISNNRSKPHRKELSGNGSRSTDQQRLRYLNIDHGFMSKAAVTSIYRLYATIYTTPYSIKNGRKNSWMLTWKETGAHTKLCCAKQTPERERRAQRSQAGESTKRLRYGKPRDGWSEEDRSSWELGGMKPGPKPRAYAASNRSMDDPC